MCTAEGPAALLVGLYNGAPHHYIAQHKVRSTLCKVLYNWAAPSYIGRQSLFLKLQRNFKCFINAGLCPAFSYYYCTGPAAQYRIVDKVRGRRPLTLVDRGLTAQDPYLYWLGAGGP